MKITTIDRNACRVIREHLDKVIADAQESFAALGLSLRVKGASFTPGDVTFKVEVATVAADGLAMTREASDFKMLASLFDLSPEDLGRTFTCNRLTFTITGCKSRATKQPILAKRADGKVFKFAPDVVKRLLAASASPSTSREA